MRRMKTLLIVVALALLLACIAVLRWRPQEPAAESVSSTSPDGSFAVQVTKPILARAPWEIPRAILGTRDEELRFDHTSRGAHVGKVAPDHLELSAEDGWDLLIETDGEGHITPGTRLIFPIVLGNRPLKFNCRPANSAPDHFNTTTRAGSDKLDGSFALRLTQCKNAVSGKNTAGLPVFTVTGSFKGLPQTAKTKDESERMK